MKRKLFIDFDATLANSLKAYCEAYNVLYKNHKDWKFADWHNTYRWDLKDVAPLVENVNEIFGHKEFFNHCDFYNSNTYEVLERLSNFYEIIIASIGIPSNLAWKSLWLEENIPFIREYVLICNSGCTMNKSIINMQDSIFIDDVRSNLDSSNAQIKICFGVTREWNVTWNGFWCQSWDGVELLLTGVKNN